MKKVINFLKRFNWQEAKNVELETLVNLIITIFCYSGKYYRSVLWSVVATYHRSSYVRPRCCVFE